MIYLIITSGLTFIGVKTLKLICLRNKTTLKFIPFVSAFELVVWTSILFWAIDIFFSRKSYYLYLIIILVLSLTALLVWFYVKDIIAGFLFKIRHNPIKNQILQSKEWNGIIKKIGVSHLSIEQQDRKWHRIPYSLLVNVTLSLLSPRSQTSSETTMKVELNPNIDPEYFTARLRESLATSSWCVACKPILVQPDLAAEGILLISFYILNPSYQALAKDKVNQLVLRLQEKQF
ncbi:MAG: hypothetical protein JNM78_00515 [Cyclobacteriaceae bacterium]|nr:hypothetical protein [Cyclobacteriaceae bacterium]